MKIWIDILYKGKMIDGYEKIVNSKDPDSRFLEIEISHLIEERIDTIIQQTKRRLTRELAKTKAASKKPTKPKPRKKKDNTTWRSASN